MNFAIPEYDELELRLSSLGEGRFQVSATGPDASRASQVIDLPFDERDIELFVARVGQPRRRSRSARSSSIEEAKRFGTALFDSVLSGPVREVYQEARRYAQFRDRGLRIRLLLSSAQELMPLPWEFLYDRPGFVAQSLYTPIVRSLDLPNSRPPRKLQPPLQILAMSSAPYGFDNLDTESERADLERALNRLSSAGAVRVRWLERATLAELHRAVSSLNEIHVFHYIGHGAFDERTDDGVLFFENDQGGPHEVTGEELCWLLRDERSLRLAVLNSCEGARTSVTDPFAGVAVSLVESGIPAVIGMQFEITDSAAVTFAESFYSAIAQGYPVDAALANARLAIWAGGHGTEFGTPVLFLRGEETRLFDVENSALPTPTPHDEPPSTGTPTKAHWTRRTTMRRAALVVGSLLLISALVFLLLRLGSNSSSTPTCNPVTADFTTQNVGRKFARTNDLGGNQTFEITGGRLRVTAPSGADVRVDTQGTMTAPYLNTVVRGDFTIETTLAADPKVGYQGAGLLVFKDLHNYVRLERGFGDFDAIAFEYFENGVHVKLNGPFNGESTPIRTRAKEVALRLSRVGDQLSASWRDVTADGPWQPLRNTAPLSGDASAGITALNAPGPGPFAASFKSLQIGCP